MSLESKCCKEKFNPVVKLAKYLKHKFGFAKANPNYFYPDGLVIFTGRQGSGKTLSAVNYVYNLLNEYPQAKLVTNIQLKDYPIVTFKDYIENNKEQYLKLKETLGDKTDQTFYNLYLKNNKVFEFRNDEDFKRYDNGKQGVIFLVDEIQLYLNSLQSKNINLDTINQISQQRKQRKHVIATSQVFGRMAKPLREQFSEVVLCENILGFIQKNQYIDRTSIKEGDNTGLNLQGQVKGKYYFIHDPEYYSRYDTYYVIDKNKFVSGENQLDIYNNQENYILEQKGDPKNERRKSK